MRYLPAILALICLGVAYGTAQDARERPAPDAPRVAGPLELVGRELDEWRAATDLRLERLETGLRRHGRVLQEHLVDHEAGEGPPPEPPRTRPTRPRPGDDPEPPPDATDWPAVPQVLVRLDPRGAPPAVELRTGPSDLAWELEDGWRHSLAYGELDDLAVLVWREQWAGVDATRTTIGVVNGFPDRGVAYLEGIRLELDGAPVFARDAHDVIDPRRPLLRRYFSGPDADAVREWRHVQPLGPPLEWLPAMYERAIEDGAAAAKTLGPYHLAFPEVVGSGSLDGSHGGRGIAPWYGGLDSPHVTCREGLRAHAEEWIRVAMRSPIATLERGTGRWWNPVRAAREARAAAIARGDENPPPAPGAWGGATVAHEPPGYEIVHVPTNGGEWTWPALDGWCAYQGALREYRYQDHTHYRRTYAAAATVARWDAPARWFLVMAWGNLALGLDGAPSDLRLLQWIPQMLATTPAGKGDHRAGRGWGHTLGCFLAAEPYLPAYMHSPSWGGTWREALAGLAAHWAMPANGWSQAEAIEGFPAPTGGWGAMQAPIAASRELDLVGVWYAPLGLEELDAAWRTSLEPVRNRAGTWRSVGEHLEVRTSATHWTEVRDRNPNSQPEYDLFRGALERFGGIDGVIAAATSDQRADELLLYNLPRQTWQETLR